RLSLDRIGRLILFLPDCPRPLSGAGVSLFSPKIPRPAFVDAFGRPVRCPTAILISANPGRPAPRMRGCLRAIFECLKGKLFQTIAVALAGMRKIDDLFGDKFGHRVNPVHETERPEYVLKDLAQERGHVRVECLAFEKSIDRHRAPALGMSIGRLPGPI